MAVGRGVSALYVLTPPLLSMVGRLSSTPIERERESVAHDYVLAPLYSWRTHTHPPARQQTLLPAPLPLLCSHHAVSALCNGSLDRPITAIPPGVDQSQRFHQGYEPDQLFH
ncbi:hypothetical protein BC831DRAFT_450555, partial [Entophlyctis helioformis]